MKKILSIVLSICLVFSVMPIAAFAAENETQTSNHPLADIAVLDENGNTIGYKVINDYSGFTYDNWTATANGNSVTITPDADKTSGKYTLLAKAGSRSVTVAYNEAIDMTGGNVKLTSYITTARYNDNTHNGSNVYVGVALGTLEFRLFDYNVPQIWYDGVKIAEGTPIVEVYDAEAGNYADRAAYIDAIKAAIGTIGSKSPYAIEVKDGVVKGYANKNSVLTELVSVALPEGALVGAVTPAVVASQCFPWSAGMCYLMGAELVTDKLYITTPVDEFIAVEPFTADKWTFVSGRTGNSSDRYNTYIAADNTFIQLGGSANPVQYDYYTTYTGKDFYVEYVDKREGSMGNDATTGRRYGVMVGDFYFCLNNGGRKPFVSYKGETVYQGETDIWDLVGAPQAYYDAVAAKGDNAFKEGANIWASKYEGNNPTYRITLKDNKLKVTYQTSTYAETVIVPEMTVNFDEFVDAKISLYSDMDSNYTGFERVYKFYMNKNNFGTYELFSTIDAVNDYDIEAEHVVGAKCMYAARALENHIPANIQKHLPASFYKKVDKYFVYELMALTEIEYSKNKVVGFTADDWTISGSGSFKTADYGTYIQGSNNNDIKVTTKNAYDLSKNFYFSMGYGKIYYNTTEGYNTTISIGDIAIKVEPSKYSATLSGATKVTITNGEEVLASATGGSYTNSSEFDAAVNTTADTFMTFAVEYDGSVFKVTVGGKVVFEDAIEVDLSNAKISFIESKLTGYSSSFAYDLVMKVDTKYITLYNLNKKMADLAKVTDYSTYSAEAEEIDLILTVLTDDQKALLDKMSVYEAYKVAYQAYQDYLAADAELIAKNVTYKFVDGLYSSEWTKSGLGDWVRGTRISDNLTMSGDGAGIYFPNVKGGTKLVSKYPMYTTDYFKITFNFTYYYRDKYIEWKVGDLRIRILNDSSGDSCNIDGYDGVMYYVYLGDTLVYQATGEANDLGLPTTPDSCSAWMFASCPFTITYNKGVLNITTNNGGTKYMTPKAGLDLTQTEAWDGTYTPNGQYIELNTYVDYGYQSLYNVTVSGKMRMATVDAIEALAATDINTAKNIYKNLTDTTYFTEATKAALDKEFVVSAEEGITYSTVIANKFTGAYRYGDSVTFTAEAAEGVNFGGWYDAEGNLLSAEAAYTCIVEPGKTIIAKAKEFEPMATVGGVAYETLADALNAVEDGQTVTLVSDITLGSEEMAELSTPGYYAGILYEGDKSFTLDLGGNTISTTADVNNDVLRFANKGSKDNTITVTNGTIIAHPNTCQAVDVGGTGQNMDVSTTLILDNLDIDTTMGGVAAVRCRIGNFLEVTDTRIVTHGGGGIYTDGGNTIIGEGVEVTVGGPTNLGDYGVAINSCASVSYNGNVIINGGTFTNNREADVVEYVLSLMYSGGTITINGGTFIGGRGGMIGMGALAGNVSNLIVNDGTFKPNENTRIVYHEGFTGDTNVTIDGVSHNAATITWDALNLGEGTTYTVKVNDVVVVSGLTTMSYNLSNLAPSTTYTVTVTAISPNTTTSMTTTFTTAEYRADNQVGDDIFWTLEDGVLTLTGTGATYDYVNVGNVNPFSALRFEIKEIVISDGITYLGNRLFRGVTQVEKITFGKDVVSTGYETFYSCLKLKTVEFNEGFRELGSLAFYNCKNLKDVELPSTLTQINNRAFKLCVALTDIVIPNSVTYTGYEVFMGDTALANVTFSENCSLINSMVFKNCTALTEFVVPAGVARIKSNAFADSGLLDITFVDERNLHSGSNGEARIASNAFSGCSDDLVMKGFENGYIEYFATSYGKKFGFEAIGVKGLYLSWVGDYKEYVDYNPKARDIVCTLENSVALHVTNEGVNVEVESGLYDGGDNGATIGLLAEHNSTVTIDGGTFRSNGARGTVVIKSGATVTINGGFFESDNGQRVLSNEGGTLVITGGTFADCDPSAFVAEGYTVTSENQADGSVWYTVAQ